MTFQRHLNNQSQKEAWFQVFPWKGSQCFVKLELYVENHVLTLLKLTCTVNEASARRIDRDLQVLKDLMTSTVKLKASSFLLRRGGGEHQLSKKRRMGFYPVPTHLFPVLH